MSRYLLSLFLLLLSLFTNAEEELLSADKAFILSVKVADNKILLNFDIAEGYYLYQNKIKVKTNTKAQLGAPEFSLAKIKDDEFFGMVGVYRNNALVKVPVIKSSADSILLTVGYQGCWDGGVCYPPITKSVIVDISDLAISDYEDATPVDYFVLAKESFPIDVDEAFKFSVVANDDNTLLAVWDIADDYYLYAHKFLIDIEGADFADIDFPQGQFKEDDFFGKTQIYTKELAVEIPLKNIISQTVLFSVSYQGCWDGGVCYPPQKKSFSIDLKDSNSTTTFANLNEADKVVEIFKQKNIILLLFSFFVFGLLLSFTPCVLPMIPILSTMIVGQKGEISIKKALAMSVVFVLAMSVVYAMIGVLAGYFGENLQILLQKPLVIILFSVIFIVLAFSMFGFFDLKLPNSLLSKLSNISSKQNSSSLVGVAIMGMLSALIVSPCVAPPLAGAFIYLGQTGDAIVAGSALFVMGLGMGVPLVLVGVSMVKLPKSGSWLDKTKQFFGVLMLALTIWMLERVIPNIFALILWALLFTIAPIAMGAFSSLSKTDNPWHRIFKALGFIVVGYGVLVWLLVARGGGDLLRPLAYLDISSNQVQKQNLQFTKIKSIPELEQILTQAEQNKQIVMLDFYADWCISCKIIKKYVFTDAKVIKKMENTIALEIDITKYSSSDKEFMKAFDVVGPPAILFFKNLKENRAKRIIGEISTEDFLRHINNI